MNCETSTDKKQNQRLIFIFIKKRKFAYSIGAQAEAYVHWIYISHVCRAPVDAKIHKNQIYFIEILEYSFYKDIYYYYYLAGHNLLCQVNC